MKKFRTAVSVIIMLLAGAVGIFVGAALGDILGGAILFSTVAGIACIIYAIDNHES